MQKSDKIIAITEVLMNNQQASQQLSTLAHKAAMNGWMPATGGNLSARTDTGFVVSASGVDKSQLLPQQFLHFNKQQQLIASQGYQPSAETKLHFKLYDLFSSALSVLHVHSVSTTVLSMLLKQDCLQLSGYEMQKTLLGVQSHEQTVRIPIFDNHQDMKCLAQQVENRLSLRPFEHGILIRGHGLYVWGKSTEQAYQHLEGLEFLLHCELLRIQVENK